MKPYGWAEWQCASCNVVGEAPTEHDARRAFRVHHMSYHNTAKTRAATAAAADAIDTAFSEAS